MSAGVPGSRTLDNELTRCMHCTVEKHGTCSSVRRRMKVAHSSASSLEYSTRGMMQYVFTHLHAHTKVLTCDFGQASTQH